MWRKRRFRQEAIAGYLFVAPNLIGFLVFQLIPIVAAVGLSFTAWDQINDPQWVGMANYRTLLKDPVFRLSLQKTFLFVIINVPLQCVGAHHRCAAESEY